MNQPFHQTCRRLLLLAAALLLTATASAQLPTDNGSRTFDLKMQQYQNQRLWHPAAPAVRQNLDSRDYRRQLQLYDQDSRQQHDPAPAADRQPRQQRERRELDLNLRLQQAQDPQTPTPVAPHFALPYGYNR